MSEESKQFTVGALGSVGEPDITFHIAPESIAVPRVERANGNRPSHDGPCRTCGALPGDGVPGARIDYKCRACGARGTWDGVSPR